MKYILVFFMMMQGLNAAHVIEKAWTKGQTFSQYLEAHEIPSDMLSSISKDDLNCVILIEEVDTLVVKFINKTRVLLIKFK